MFSGNLIRFQTETHVQTLFGDKVKMQFSKGLPYIDKCEGDFRRAVVGSQPVPDRKEASQRRSRVGTGQDHLKQGNVSTSDIRIRRLKNHLKVNNMRKVLKDLEVTWIPVFLSLT